MTRWWVWIAVSWGLGGWTCAEQPSFGNELHVWVRDENGVGLEGVPVAVRPADTTDPGSMIYNGDGEPLPGQIVTGADGHAMAYDYCNTATVNVWGHWSYTVELQRDPSATEVCVTENDHAGMSACGEPRHIHHHPDVRACWTP